MPAVGAAIFAVASSVVTVAAAVAATIGAAVAGITTVISSAVAGIASAIGGALGGLVKVVTDIIALPGKLISGQLAIDFEGISLWIDLNVSTIASKLATVINAITLPVVLAINTIKGGIGAGLAAVVGIIDVPATVILEPIKETLEIVKGAVDAIKEPVDMVAGSFQQVREVISDIASLKIINEILADTTDISGLLGPIAQGKSIVTARAIATLVKSIAGTTVATMDKIDSEYKLLGATIDTFDEQIATTVKEKVALAKVSVLAAVTPKMTTLGTNQQIVIKGIARISRHIEDESWFAAMLIRILR